MKDNDASSKANKQNVTSLLLNTLCVCVLTNSNGAAEHRSLLELRDSPARKDKLSPRATTHTQNCFHLKREISVRYHYFSLSLCVSSVSAYLERHCTQRGTTLRVWTHCFLGIVISHTHTEFLNSLSPDVWSSSSSSHCCCCCSWTHLGLKTPSSCWWSVSHRDVSDPK